MALTRYQYFVTHGILTKLSSLIHLYSVIFLFFFYNSLTIKQVIPVSSNKSLMWNVIYITWIVMNTLLYFRIVEKPVLDLKIKQFSSVHGSFVVLEILFN